MPPTQELRSVNFMVKLKNSKKQCCGCGSESFWSPGSASGSESASNKNTDTYQIKIRIWIRIRIRIKVISWIRICIDLQITIQNVRNISLFEHFSKGYSLYLEARIWIWIRIRIPIRVKSRVRIHIQ